MDDSHWLGWQDDGVAGIYCSKYSADEAAGTISVSDDPYVCECGARLLLIWDVRLMEVE